MLIPESYEEEMSYTTRTSSVRLREEVNETKVFGLEFYHYFWKVFGLEFTIMSFFGCKKGR